MTSATIPCRVAYWRNLSRGKYHRDFFLAYALADWTRSADP